MTRAGARPQPRSRYPGACRADDFLEIRAQAPLHHIQILLFLLLPSLLHPTPFQAAADKAAAAAAAEAAAAAKDASSQGSMNAPYPSPTPKPTFNTDPTLTPTPYPTGLRDTGPVEVKLRIAILLNDLNLVAQVP